MNRSLIEYLTHVWNWAPGCAHPQGIEAGQFAKTGFKPRIRENILEQPFPRKPSRIGVNFMGEGFGAWVERHYIQRAMLRAYYAKEHTFVWLTKNPERLAECGIMAEGRIPWGANSWVMTTITGAESPERQQAMIDALRRVQGAGVLGVSFEPMLGPLAIELTGIDWLVLGAQTGKGAVKPDGFWIPRFDGPVWEKNNLPAMWFAGFQRVQDLPKGAAHEN